RVPQAQGWRGRRCERGRGVTSRRSPSAPFEQIGYEVDGGVCTVTLDRPAKLNAVTTVMIGELIQAFDHADADDAVRVVIVTGAGRAFCAGADLSRAGPGPRARRPGGKRGSIATAAAWSPSASTT